MMNWQSNLSRRLAGLAAGVSLLALSAALGAAAQDAATATNTKASAEAKADAAEQITVTGRTQRGKTPGGGLLPIETAPKAVQAITRDFIAKQVPTANSQQMLKELPSANVSDVDPWGLYSGQSTVRGMDETEIGWSVDGLPLNDIGGGQYYANEVLEAEDLDTVTLQPGATNIDSPTVNATAGIVIMKMLPPSHTPGWLIDATMGNHALNREYVRYNTGDIGNSDARGMIAFSHTYADMWRGPGNANKNHVDSKWIKDFNNGSQISLTVSYNDQVNDSYENTPRWRSGTSTATAIIMIRASMRLTPAITVCTSIRSRT